MRHTSLIVTDLDGTLGDTDAEIAKSLRSLDRLPVGFALCVLTGKSLRSLAALENAIQPGTLVAPWGGGNLLRYTGSDYQWVTPTNVVAVTSEVVKPEYVAVPKRVQLTTADEVHVRVEQLSCDLAAVSAYWKFAENDEASAWTLARRNNLCVSSGRNCHWVTLSPMNFPRRWTVRHCRELCRAEHVLYLGDASVDAECIDQVDRFFAPAGCELAGRAKVTAFDDVESLVSTLLSGT